MFLLRNDVLLTLIDRSGNSSLEVPSSISNRNILLKENVGNKMTGTDLVI